MGQLSALEAYQQELLFDAARSDKTGTEISRILDAGCDPSWDTDSDVSALHHAASSGNHVTLQILLNRGANPNPQWSRSPLLAAAERGSLKCCEHLINAGARGLGEALQAARTGFGEAGPNEPTEERDYNAVISLLQSKLLVAALEKKSDVGVEPSTVSSVMNHSASLYSVENEVPSGRKKPRC